MSEMNEQSQNGKRMTEEIKTRAHGIKGKTSGSKENICRLPVNKRERLKEAVGSGRQARTGNQHIDRV